MDQHLLPPYAPTTMDLKTPSGKLPIRFQPLAPKSTTPIHGDENRSDRCSGGLCRTFVLCVLALAVCGGFVLLYLQMRNLEQQVQELRELTYEGGSYGPFDDDQTEPEWTSHSKSHNKNRDPFSDTPEWDHDGDDAAQNKGHTRERRSISSTSSQGRVSHLGMHQGASSAHVVPLSDGQSPQPDDFYHLSAWFMWTDQEDRISHASIPLHSSGKYLVAPHAGYYYIYSQVTIKSCNNGTDSIGRGHSLYVKTMCGQSEGQELTHTVTTPYHRNAGCTYDSGYIGGVYYLEKFDYVGVKPFLYHGFLQSRIFLKQSNSYFGMILISKVQVHPRCHLRQSNY